MDRVCNFCVCFSATYVVESSDDVGAVGVGEPVDEAADCEDKSHHDEALQPASPSSVPPDDSSPDISGVSAAAPCDTIELLCRRDQTPCSCEDQPDIIQRNKVGLFRRNAE